MLTRLLPTKIVDKTLSKFSAKSRAFFAPLWPSCAFTRSLVLLTEENAVSVAEKKADKVYEFINFDAVKNSRIKAVDIYSVIGMPISSELKTKLVDNKLLTSEEIALYNANFNLNDEIEEE